MGRIILFFTLILYSLPSLGQVYITGQVRDQTTGEPLSFANVYVKGTLNGTVVLADGSYQLKVIKGDSITLVCTFSGYQALSRDVVAAADLEVNFDLTTNIRELGFVEVNGLRDYPMTITRVSKEELDKRNLGVDLPILLRFTPSVVTTSDAGAGIGYTGIRIRGSDATRTNVTINGIALNDPESHGVFWVNMPDFATSAQSITIQRGVGTSVNGAGAFGASVNIMTQRPDDHAWAETSHGFGSFGTRRHNLQVNSGKLGEHFAVYGRYSRIESDGFIDNAFVDLSSWFVSGTYTGKLGQFTANVFSGNEVTFQAWNGVPESELAAGNRTFNELAVYDDETDNYQQDHYQLIYDKAIGRKFAINAALHYTHGKGYFEQYQHDPNLFHNVNFSDYGLDNVTIGDSTITQSRFVRRLWLDNDFYGAVVSANYESSKITEGRSDVTAAVGGAWNRYEGKHYGEVIWAEMMSDGFIRHRFYENDATKTDFNLYAKTNAKIMGSLYGFVDLQVRSVDYQFVGVAFGPQGEPTNLPQSVSLTFFNPKVGLTYYTDQSQAYASFAVGNKEPNRSDFVNNPENERPTHETLYNLEAGYLGYRKNFNYGINFYHMQYDNQLVVTGKVNNVGELTRQNVKSSFRQGLELQARAELGAMSIGFNGTLSQNRVNDFVEYLDDFDNGGQLEIKHGDTDIAFSPNTILNFQFSYRPVHSLELGTNFKSVSSQYLDNTSTASRQLDGFSTVDLRVNWQLRPKNFRLVELSLMINNLLDEAYEPNGYTFGYRFGGEDIYENRYYPQAGINFLAGVRVRI